jgi:hypothetical protein
MILAVSSRQRLQYLERMRCVIALILLAAAAFADQAPAPKASKGAEALIQTDRAAWPGYHLKSGEHWLLNLPKGEPFGASGLLLMTNGDLLTLRDRSPTLYRVEFIPNTNALNLVAITNVFASKQLKKFAREKTGYYDSEGIARDDTGRLYVCEEASRWIIRYDPAIKEVERLKIDWSPVQDFFSTDRNASFEGIAIGGDTLYVANERSSPLIVAVDLKSLQIRDHFQVFPRKPSFLGTHYSDLSWFDGRLYVLCRQHRVILAVDPVTHKILGEFDYSDIEDQLGYQTRFPVGIMEGLAVSTDTFWLVTDNNDLPRNSALQDRRPTLLKISRPDVPKP